MSVTVSIPRPTHWRRDLVTLTAFAILLSAITVLIVTASYYGARYTLPPTPIVITAPVPTAMPTAVPCVARVGLACYVDSTAGPIAVWLTSYGSIRTELETPTSEVPYGRNP